MTKIIITLVLFLVSLMAHSQEKDETPKIRTITATVTNASSDKGLIYFSIYKKEGFQQRDAIQALNATITDGKSTVEFKIENAGNYAIICYHDSNSNKRMDFSENGMPIEDYGASNNVMAFGPPQFEAAKFEVSDKDLEFEIKF